ncbi:16S rRNA (guanine(966)-N(2))-methyltransferase RsmD [Latilactobacillus sakei]|uniref:16S rRNA (guanine(966)-N(2))-methyltransferase RsmD n=1 Tax=Latilactobacillus sakei TaxID=1599 RepID=UPI003F53351D
MRIIAGEFGGRRLKAVPGMKTRPTTDKVKEAMFSMLGQFFDGGQALDLYAGSGGLAIEAVSRGMDHAYLIDRQYAAIQTIQDNVAVTKMPECFTIWKMPAEKALLKLADAKEQFDLILLDPPYKQQQMLLELQQFVKMDLLKLGAIILCETDTSLTYPEEIPHYTLKRQQNYGITEVAIFEFIG